jgi:hypothetical protein
MFPAYPADRFPTLIVMRRRTAILAAVALAVGATVAEGAGSSRPRVGGCTVFPANNPWNQRVDKLPVAGNSDAIVRSIGVSEGMHADFGSGLYNGGPIGIPYTSVGKGQKKVSVKFGYASESDKGPYPVPKNAPIEGGRSSGGDRHVIVVDRSACKLYELYAAYPVTGGASWRAGSGAIWSLRSNHLRPKTWTSADAAGLPILPGLARYPEVKAGAINHALRFTVSRTRNTYVYPARHQASSDSNPNLPPMGLRLRLKASFPVSSYPRQSRIVLRALQRYGMIVADNGSDWYVSGAPNKGWNNDDLHHLGAVTGGNFEVVDTRSLPHPGR